MVEFKKLCLTVGKGNIFSQSPSKHHIERKEKHHIGFRLWFPIELYRFSAELNRKKKVCFQIHTLCLVVGPHNYWEPFSTRGWKKNHKYHSRLSHMGLLTGQFLIKFDIFKAANNLLLNNNYS